MIYFITMYFILYLYLICMCALCIYFLLIQNMLNLKNIMTEIKYYIIIMTDKNNNVNILITLLKKYVPTVVFIINCILLKISPFMATKLF